MELSRYERGGKLQLVAFGALALCLAGVAKAGILILNRNEHTPVMHGGWTEIDFEQ